MVFVRHDGVKKPLQAPYDGPFPVLEPGEKVFKILKNGLPYTVSVDRLKICYSATSPPSSMIPNRSPPPKPSDVGPSPPAPVVALLPSGSVPHLPPPSALPDVSGDTDFPPLPPPLFTSSGRRSKPRKILDL